MMEKSTKKYILIFTLILIIGAFFILIWNVNDDKEKSKTAQPNNICDISNYGASKKKLNTKAFSKAIDDCSQKGGGTVNVPPGTWKSGPIHLKSNINLHLEKEAVIKFDTDLENYLPAVFSRFEGVEYFNYSPPIYALDAKNVAITGRGKLDGQEKDWKKDAVLREDSVVQLFQMVADDISVEKRNFAKEEYLIQPSFIQFVNCDGILIEDVTIKDSPNWTVHPIYSQNITIRNVTIDTSGQNTDGVAIDSSKDVLIEKSSIHSGDDAIAIKSGADKDGRRVNRPSENITIRNLKIFGGHSAIAIGSEMSGGIRNVRVENINAQNVKYGIRIKSAPSRGGTVENIFFTDMDIDRASEDAIRIDLKYREIAENEERIVPTFRNITIENFQCAKTKNAAVFIGLPDSPIENLTLKNVRIDAKNKVYSENIKNEKFEKLRIEIRE